MLGKCLHPFYVNGFYAPCGKCAYCLKKRKSDWTTRCTHELVSSDFGYFITLTYDPEHIPDKYSLNKKHLQDFWKRFRYYLKDVEYKIKYFACGEYGPKTHRPHYHAAVFFKSKLEGASPLLSAKDFSDRRAIQAHIVSLIIKSWSLGHAEISELNQQRVGYTVGYCQKKLFDKRAYSGSVQRPFQIQSLGIGKSHCLANATRYRTNPFVRLGGYIKALPRYYRKLLSISRDTLRDNLIAMRREYADAYRKETGEEPYAKPFPFANYNRIAILRGFFDGSGVITPHYLDWLHNLARQINIDLTAKFQMELARSIL